MKPPVVWRNDRILHTFLLSTFINNCSEQERRKCLCMRNKVQRSIYAIRLHPTYFSTVTIATVPIHFHPTLYILSKKEFRQVLLKIGLQDLFKYLGHFSSLHMCCHTTGLDLLGNCSKFILGK